MTWAKPHASLAGMGMLNPGAIAAYWRRADAPGRRADWIAIAIFFAVACGWSYFAARWGDLRLPGGPDAPKVNGALLIGFGPVLGALVAGGVRGDRGTWPAGFRGLSKRWSMIALLIPIVFAGLLGVRRFHVEPHVDAAVITATLVIACAAEEIGWREWLYNMLAGLPLWASALITWALWLVWHAAFVTVAGDQLGESFDPTYVVGLLIASFVLAVVVRQTRSSGIAAAWRATAALDAPLGLIAIVAIVLAGATWKAAAPSAKPTP